MKRVYIIVICLMGGLLLGCGGGYVPNRNHKADDKISRAIYEELGKEVIYKGKEIKEDNTVYYKYYVDEQSDQIGRIHAAAQKIIEQEGIDDKVCIDCWEEYCDALESVVRFYNYSDGSENADCEGLQRLIIKGHYINENSIYNQADTYSSIQGIKYLQVEWEMADVTEKENIDWYEYFPDLETLEIVPIEN